MREERKCISKIPVIDPYVENGMCDEAKMTLSGPNDAAQVEIVLGIRFPAGYMEFVTTLGQGEYCNYIRIDMPKTIESEWKKRQEFLDEYFFWEMADPVLSKKKVIESIQIGSTIDGDVLIFHPDNPDKLFVLPRHDDKLYEIGTDLYEAIDWLCVSRHTNTGNVGETHIRRYFVPYNPLQYDHGILRPKGF